MSITPVEITEAIIDDLAITFAGRSPTISVTRTGPSTLDLGYGEAGHFTLIVAREPSPENPA
jgi:hypothetical protein